MNPNSKWSHAFTLIELLVVIAIYNTNALPQVNTVFRCPKDNVGRFKQNGASYAWNAWYNRRDAQIMRTSQNPVSEAMLIWDYENWHGTGTNGTKNCLYVDYHLSKL